MTPTSREAHPNGRWSNKNNWKNCWWKGVGFFWSDQALTRKEAEFTIDRKRVAWRKTFGFDTRAEHGKRLNERWSEIVEWSRLNEHVSLPSWPCLTSIKEVEANFSPATDCEVEFLPSARVFVWVSVCVCVLLLWWSFGASFWCADCWLNVTVHRKQ